MFGDLVVLGRGDDYISPVGRRATRWHCRCLCGNEVDVVKRSLVSGSTKSCGCRRQNNHAHVKDLTGKRFGRLVVIGPAVDEYNVVIKSQRSWKWRCVCDCGVVKDINGMLLQNGNTISCGCYSQEVTSVCNTNNLVGRTFGKLTVLYRADDYLSPGGQRQTKWHCRCECGNEVDVIGQCLSRGITTSCGCIRSHLEYNVLQYFNNIGYKSGVDYETQKRYDDLLGFSGRKLSYDFLVYRDGQPYCLIECQGEQHYRAVDRFGGQEMLEKRQEYDLRKRMYAEQIGLPLVEILYTADTYDKVVAILHEYDI